MKTSYRPAFVTFAALALSGCRPHQRNNALPADASRRALVMIEDDGTLRAPAEPTVPVAEMQQAVAKEVELRKKVETKLEQQESAKARWQLIAMVAIACAVLLLIAGVVLGSRARHDAEG